MALEEDMEDAAEDDEAEDSQEGMIPKTDNSCKPEIKSENFVVGLGNKGSTINHRHNVGSEMFQKFVNKRYNINRTLNIRRGWANSNQVSYLIPNTYERRQSCSLKK